MNAEQKLAEFGVTLGEAYQFIVSNLNSPETIFNVARQFGIDSSMLAEIVEQDFPGINAQTVESFFSGLGLDGSALNSANIGSGSGSGSSGGGSGGITDAELQLFQLLVKENTETGILSTEALRSAVIGSTTFDLNTFSQVTVTQAQYDAFFDGSALDQNGDGSYSPDELGYENIPQEFIQLFDADAESLYYGTQINYFKAIDQAELSEFTSLSENATEEQVTQLLIGILEDPASPPLYDDQTLAQTIVQVTGLTVVAANTLSFDSSLFAS